jgi:hypothetical protein
MPQYNWNIVESGIKYHKPKPKQIFSRRWNIVYLFGHCWSNNKGGGSCRIPNLFISPAYFYYSCSKSEHRFLVTSVSVVCLCFVEKKLWKKRKHHLEPSLFLYCTFFFLRNNIFLLFHFLYKFFIKSNQNTQ